MVEIKTKVGAKGQIVIPKPFREEYGIMPGSTVALKEEEGKITISRPNADVVGTLRRMAKKGGTYNSDEAYDEEMRERLKKAGIVV